MATLEHLEAVAQSHLPAYRRMARRYLRDFDDAEEAVQDAFVLAVRKLHQFSGESKLSTWVGTIVINCARMKRRGYRVLEELPDANLLLDFSVSGQQLVIRAERAQALHAAIHKLPATYRAVVRLRLDDMDMGQIARHLDIPLGTVKNSMFRARLKLRDSLASHA